MGGQRRLQIRNCIRQLPRLDLRNSQRSLVLHSFEMGNRLGRVALHEQDIAQQLMSRRRVWVQVQSMLQRSHGGREIALLHVSLAEADEAVREVRIELGDFSKLGNGNIELSLFICRDRKSVV